MPHYHAVVWMDQKEAKIFYFNAKEADQSHVLPEHAHHLSNKGSGHGHTENPAYYHSVVEKVTAAGEVLIVGPGQAKSEFMKHIASHDPALMKKIVGVETVDHPSDKQVVAYARHYFKAADRMRA